MLKLRNLIVSSRIQVRLGDVADVQDTQKNYGESGSCEPECHYFTNH
jgi:multidrug efflux pump subunit AcrB